MDKNENLTMEQLLAQLEKFKKIADRDRKRAADINRRRYETDEKYRESRKEYMREYYQKKKANQAVKA
jgi:hypothetical protein